MTLQDYLAQHIKEQNAWVSKGSILRREWKDRHSTTVLPSTVDRALRLLEEKKIIGVKYEGKNTLYKWIPAHIKSRYIPTAERTDPSVYLV